MRTKYILPLMLIIVILTIASLLLFDLGSVDVSFNFIKYHTAQADGKEFVFYGSFGKIGKVTVKNDEKKLCSLEIYADAYIYDNISAIELCDINADEKNDILVAFEVDEDGDIHRRLFVANNNGYTEVNNVDIINFEEDNGTLISEERKLTYLAETLEEYTVPYNRSVNRTVYEYYDGNVIPRSRIAVSYYSESNIYCVGRFEYSEDLEELISISEDWLDVSEYSLVYDSLDEIFDVELP